MELQIIKNMIESGMKIEEIAKVTKIDKSKIEEVCYNSHPH